MTSAQTLRPIKNTLAHFMTTQYNPLSHGYRVQDPLNIRPNVQYRQLTLNFPLARYLYGNLLFLTSLRQYMTILQVLIITFLKLIKIQF